MTPKEQYEAKKAAKFSTHQPNRNIRDEGEAELMLLLIERFVLAVEQIAGALEKKA